MRWCPTGGCSDEKAVAAYREEMIKNATKLDISTLRLKYALAERGDFEAQYELLHDIPKLLSKIEELEALLTPNQQ
jgi:hypothetical protein